MTQYFAISVAYTVDYNNEVRIEEKIATTGETLIEQLNKILKRKNTGSPSVEPITQEEFQKIQKYRNNYRCATFRHGPGMCRMFM